MLREFFDWWLTNLKAWLPDSLQSQLRQHLCLLYLDIDKNEVDIHASYRGEQHRFGRVPLGDEAEDHPQLQSYIANLPRLPERIIVRLGRGRFLSREVDLPLAAEENLNEAIGFQLEQLTPFAADKVIQFNGIKQRLPAEKQLKAWLVVTPIEPVDQALQLLAGPPPTPFRMPNHAPVQNEYLQIAFRPFGSAGNSAQRTTLLLGGLLALLLIGVASLHIHNRMATRDYLSGAIDQIRVQAAEASGLRSRIDQMQEQANYISVQRLNSPRFLPLLNDLSERLDTNTWVQRLDLRGPTLNIQGVSSNASQLIEELEQSPWLEQVSFAASVTRDRSTGRDRFNIEAQVVNPTGEAP